MVTVNDSWLEIEQYVLGLEKKTAPDIWRAIHQNPISKYFIDKL